MNNRDWFSLALRLFGVWLLVQSIESIASQILLALSLINAGQNVTYILFQLFWFTARTTIGLVLLFFAPAISTRFYPQSVSSSVTAEFAEVKLLKIGLQLLGVYALLLAVQSAAGVILGVLSGDERTLAFSTSFSGSEARYINTLLTCGLNLAFGAILLIWNERVVFLIEKFRYLPERDAYEPPSLDE